MRIAERWAKALRIGHKWARCPECLGDGIVMETDANDVTKDGVQRVYSVKCPKCKGVKRRVSL